MTEQRTLVNVRSNTSQVVNGNEVAHIALESSALMVIWNASKNIGNLVTFEVPGSSNEFLQELKKKVLQLLKDSDVSNPKSFNSESVVLKAVFPDQTLEKVKPEVTREFANFGFSETKIATYHGRSQVYFFPDTGKVRFSESTDSRSNNVNENISNRKKRVLIVDDSKTIQKLLTSIIQVDPNLEVVGYADLPSQVESLIQKYKPDVITLDIHMPEMDGVKLLSIIHPKYRIPTIMISSLSMEDGDFVMRALEIGAVDYVQKPSLSELESTAITIREKLKAAANAKVALKSSSSSTMQGVFTTFSPDVLNTNRIIAIGASTGGTEAIRAVFSMFPQEIPPIVVVQHIPAVFSTAFAKRLDALCPFEVKEAKDGDLVKCNQVLIAPGGLQMEVVQVASGNRVRITDSPPVNRHKPSVDVLFDSVAKIYGKKAVGVLLTGMGTDGAKGLLQMKTSGARTIAQDEESCVVFGMPRAAIQLGAAEKICTLNKVPEMISKLISDYKPAKAA